MIAGSLQRGANLAISPDEALHVAILAREFDAIGISPTEKVYSGEAPVINGADLTEASSRTSTHPVLSELRAAVNGLNIEAQRDLLALVWVGRGDYAPSGWSTARRHARKGTHLHVGQYLAETPLAGDYLIKGLLALGYEIEDAED